MQFKHVVAQDEAGYGGARAGNDHWFLRIGERLKIPVEDRWKAQVALHEFGHALVAFWGGDRSVVDKGYLTLNPLKYTHPFLSLVLPMLILVLGGIGLPGGAVYINRLGSTAMPA